MDRSVNTRALSLRPGQRLIAVSDIHGNLRLFDKLLDQVAYRDWQNPFGIGIPCFQPHQIGFVDQLQFCRILNCDNSFLPWDKL